MGFLFKSFIHTYILFAFLLSCNFFASTEAYDPLDQNGNITIKWDIMSWTPDGYSAIVTIFNFQQYRHIPSPGWTLGWTWANKEVIWTMFGGQATEQGDCSRFKQSIPHCCKKNPTIVDLLPGAPSTQQTSNCCRGGVISSWAQDPSNAVSAFQLFVGSSGSTNKTVRLPKNFTLRAPGPGYTCSAAKIIRPTQFVVSDIWRTTQALMTWNVVCKYSPFLVQKTPSCCVSLTSFYDGTIVSCPTCACGCQNNATKAGKCEEPRSIQCSNHMCPIRVHWHVRRNDKKYWWVRITIVNYNYITNYSQWNLVVQHPNFNYLRHFSGFYYKSLSSYTGINDTGMFWGVKFYNDQLMQARRSGSGDVQCELVFQKSGSTFKFHNRGWAFPQRIYFNGDNCVMRPPDVYPWMPNAAAGCQFCLIHIMTYFWWASVVLNWRP